MIRITKWLLLALVSCTFFGAKARAQTINAPSCSSSAVQAALNSVAADGTTVIIPSGSCSWTSAVSYSANFSVSVIGQSAIATTDAQGNPATFNDTTTIIDNVPHNSGGPDYLLNISVPAGKSFRLSGLTIQGGSTGTISNNGVVTIGGSSQSVRIDHCHFVNNTQLALNIDGHTFGVSDHDLFNISRLGVRELASGWSGGTHGDSSWADTSTLGSNRFFFTENSTFIGGIAYNDCQSGGRFVFRFNTLIGGTSTGGLQTHPTGHAGDDRGCRVWEIYGNVFSGPGGAQSLYNAMFASSGTGVMWNNVIPPTYSHILTFHNMRRNNGTYPQNPSPSGWGYCGTSFNGTGSVWDQNSNTTNGHACIDQVGRGIGDLISGTFPNKINTVSGTIAWPHQAAEPVYEWMDTGWSGLAAYYAPSFDGGINQDSDYYVWCDPASKSGCLSFNGTSGVGSGLLATRPTTCTTGVAFWATDTSTLYQCKATNTWAAYYTPYTYPHPLTAGSGTAPGPPTNLQAIVN